MATIRVTCHHCTTSVLLGPAQVLLIPPSGADGFGDYLFFCPRCGRATIAAAGAGQVLLLLAAGVAADGPDPTAANGDPAPESGDLPAAAPLTLDDVSTFHLLLADDNWFTRLTAVSTRRPVPRPHLPEEFR
jgi:hypothetical protein